MDMDTSDSTMARQIAEAARAFEHQRTGRAPQSVTVVLSGETLVITVRGALSPAETALARSPDGAAQVQEFHKLLFATACGPLRDEIKRITGVAVREATEEVENATGTLMQVFTGGTTVQVFLLAAPVPADSWCGENVVKTPVKPTPFI
jgi:uncharacterized protein YbcI